MQNNETTFPVFKSEKATATVRGYIGKEAESFDSGLNGGSFDPRNKLVIGYTILYQDDRIASIRFSEQKRHAGQPTELATRFMTLDLGSGRELAFKDLFVKTEGFGSLLYDYFKQDHGNDLSIAQQFGLLKLTPENIHQFWVEPGYIGFMLNFQNPTESQDQKRMSIAGTVLSGSVKPEYITAKKGDTPLPVAYIVSSKPKPADEIDPNGKMIALTFDDGPGPFTDRVLDVLKQYHAHATFFMIGRQVGGRATTVNRVVTEGNEIGNHSWDHVSLPTIGQPRLTQEILDTQRAIQAATGGYTPILMRPPYGAVNPAVQNYLTSQGLRTALWTADTQDWRHQDNSQSTYAAIMGAANDGQVILVHDIHQASVEAVERAVPELRQQGYQLVTMSELERYR
ncbi:MAG TPA: polysaccharide deacetylase family protein [Candidatus Saccharimonadales bacterium]|nr:polysaccharide deacetylase family protein [Candidatus Saccharimonadales bacterium]